MTLLGAGKVSSAAAGLSYTRTDSVADLASHTTYTFASVNIGAASATRVLLIGCHGYGSGSPQAAASLTVNGVSASLLSGTGVTQNSVGSGVFALAVSSGTTATIVLTWAGAMLSGGIIVFALDGVNATPTQIDTDQGFSSNLSSTITVPSGGVAISFAGTAASATANGSFTNSTEDGTGFSVSPNADNTVRFQAAHNASAGAQTPTFTPSGSDGMVLHTIAFGP